MTAITEAAVEAVAKPNETMMGVCYRTGPLTVDDYNEAIAALMGAKSDLLHKMAGRFVGGCFICEDSGHTAEFCHHNPLILARERAATKKIWQCWHCGFEARTSEEAQDHFGASEDEVARCLKDRAALTAAAPHLAGPGWRVPDGWKLVPVKATPEMFDAIEYRGDDLKKFRATQALIYFMMVRAAPLPPAPWSAIGQEPTP